MAAYLPLALLYFLVGAALSALLMYLIRTRTDQTTWGAAAALASPVAIFLLFNGHSLTESDPDLGPIGPIYAALFVPYLFAVLIVRWIVARRANK